MTLRTAALSHRAPSPGSATPRVAVEASGAPGAAATAMCPAMMTQSAMTTTPSPTSSTSLIQAPWARPPRRAWTHPTLHHRSLTSFILYLKPLKASSHPVLMIVRWSDLRAIYARLWFCITSTFNDKNVIFQLLHQLKLVTAHLCSDTCSHNVTFIIHNVQCHYIINFHHWTDILFHINEFYWCTIKPMWCFMMKYKSLLFSCFGVFFPSVQFWLDEFW